MKEPFLFLSLFPSLLALETIGRWFWSRQVDFAIRIKLNIDTSKDFCVVRENCRLLVFIHKSPEGR